MNVVYINKAIFKIFRDIKENSICEVLLQSQVIVLDSLS